MLKHYSPFILENMFLMWPLWKLISESSSLLQLLTPESFQTKQPWRLIYEIQWEIQTTAASQLVLKTTPLFH